MSGRTNRSVYLGPLSIKWSKKINLTIKLIRSQSLAKEYYGEVIITSTIILLNNTLKLGQLKSAIFFHREDGYCKASTQLDL